MIGKMLSPSQRFQRPLASMIQDLPIVGGKGRQTSGLAGLLKPLLFTEHPLSSQTMLGKISSVQSRMIKARHESSLLSS